MKRVEFPRVLIISNNALTKTGSNGRVLSNLFYGWNQDCLAQFYTSAELPDSPVCRRYYRVTDKEALKSFLFFRKGGARVELAQRDVSAQNFSSKSTINKNPLTSLLRDIVWNARRWIAKDFWAFIEEFKPDVILVYMGNSSRLLNLARTISEKYNIPIVTYNTENYYFKNYNYFFGKPFGFLYPIYRWQFCRAYEKLIKKTKMDIYLNDLLRSQNEERFQKPAKVIYHSSNLPPFEAYNKDIPSFLYAGNLGINRHLSLMQIGEALTQINASYAIDVYGRAEPEVEQQLRQAKGICYHGAVSYEELKTVMAEHQFLFHIESFEPNMVKDLNGAFSTKIADSLWSNRCFVVYADGSLACSQYLLANECACVISSQGKLKDTLQKLIEDEQWQKRLIAKAQIVAEENHNVEKNRQKMYEVICEAAKG